MKGKTRELEPTVFLLARLIMGAVFLYASYDKILHPHAFAQAIYNYQILPDMLINLSALFLPWTELILGLCLITGFWLPGASLLAALLMTVFTGALVYNEIRGLDVACGCFTTQGDQGPANFYTIIRDLIFLSLSLYMAGRILFSGKTIQKTADSS